MARYPVGITRLNVIRSGMTLSGGGQIGGGQAWTPGDTSQSGFIYTQDDTLDIAWAPPIGATSVVQEYRVVIDDDRNFGSPKNLYPGQNRSIKYKVSRIGKRYYVYVVARYTQGWDVPHTPSTVQSVLVPDVPGQQTPPTVTLAPPRAVIGTAIPPHDGGGTITDYHWELSTSTNQAGVFATAVSRGPTSPAFGSAELGTTVYCRFRAVNQQGPGPWSGWRPFAIPPVAVAPAKPTIPPTQNISSLTINWLPPTNTYGRPVTEYLIQTAYTPDFRLDPRLTRVSGSVRTVAIHGLLPGRTHYARVLAVTSQGWSAWSPTASDLMVGSVWVVVSGVRKRARTFVKVGSIWKPAQPYVCVYDTATKKNVWKVVGG